MLTWRVAALAAVAAGVLAAPAPATAAPDGQLKQLALPDGCLHDAGAGLCRNLTLPLQAVGEPAISDDGRFIYVPGRGSNSVNVLERDATTGGA